MLQQAVHSQPLTREAVGIFTNLEKLEEAVNELEATDFPRHDISALGNREEMKSTYGRGAIDPKLIQDSAYVPRSHILRPEEKTIGASVTIGVLTYLGGFASLFITQPSSDTTTIISVLCGSILGAIAGLCIVTFILNKFRASIDRQLKRGGLLLWVRTPNKDKERKATKILNKYGAKNVHIHEVN